jgi:hypothetical protein
MSGILITSMGILSHLSQIVKGFRKKMVVL